MIRKIKISPFKYLVGRHGSASRRRARAVASEDSRFKYLHFIKNCYLIVKT